MLHCHCCGLYFAVMLLLLLLPAGSAAYLTPWWLGITAANLAVQPVPTVAL
jgi:hypothetical protein